MDTVYNIIIVSITATAPMSNYAYYNNNNINIIQLYVTKLHSSRFFDYLKLTYIFLFKKKKIINKFNQPADTHIVCINDKIK